MKLLISGGHITPAVALIHYARSRGDEVVIAGRTVASYQARTQSPEESLAQEYGCTFVPFKAIKFDRYHKTSSLLNAWRFMGSLWQAGKIIRTHKPDVVVSFGSFVGVPLIVASKLLRVPTVIHEQTTASGLANQLTARMADRIALSYASAQAFFPKKKTQVIGNLVRAEIWTKQARPAWATSLPSKPILFITGGSQGSHVINQTVLSILPQLLDSFAVVIQTGSSQLYADYQQVIAYKQQLPPSLQKALVVKKWFSASEVGWLLQNAWAVIARSGGNTVSELMVTGTPSILIPLPGSQKNEQEKNARLLVDAGAGMLVLQADLSPETLHSSVETMQSQQTSMKQRATALKKLQNPQAAEELYTLLLAVRN